MSTNEGIVLCGTRFKESSKILTIYTPTLGKIKVMAQGVLKPKSSELAISEVFALSEFSLKKGRNFYYINSTELIDSHYVLRQEYEKMVLGFNIIELVDKLTLEEEPNEKLYFLLKTALSTLCKTKNLGALLIAFSLKAATFSGYRPHMSSCVKCGNKKSKEWIFDNIEGGIICEDCYSSSDNVISLEELKQLNQLLMAKFSDLDDIPLKSNELKRLEMIVTRYILDNTEIREFKSSNLVRECTLHKQY